MSFKVPSPSVVTCNDDMFPKVWIAQDIVQINAAELKLGFGIPHWKKREESWNRKQMLYFTRL
jgi:hypothetical protein